MTGRRGGLALSLLVIMTAFQVSIVITPSAAVATTLYVGGAGPGNHTTIQEAIIVANPFDTIYVYSGVYVENLVIDVSVILIGESKETAIIDGGWTSSVVDINVFGVTLREFTVRNSGTMGGDRGVDLGYVENCRIENNIIRDNNDGIFLYHSSNNTIANNSIHDNENGTYLSLSDNNTIVDNNVSSNTMLGINLGASGFGVVSGNTVSGSWEGISVSLSNNTQVFGNTVVNNDYGISLVYAGNTTAHNNTVSGSDYGIMVKYDSNNSVVDNTVSNSTTSGIYLKLANNNTVQGNTALDSKHGIYLYLSDDNEVRSNEVIRSTEDGLVLWSSNTSVIADNTFSENVGAGSNLYSSFGNRFFHNNFLDNDVFQAVDFLGYNYWDDGYPSGGNYWDEYEGEDEMSGPNQDQPGYDGIGDTSQDVWGGALDDRYPLMHPSGGVPPYKPYKTRFLNASGGDEEVDLNWTAPSFDGDSPITNYTIYRGTSLGNIGFLIEVDNVLNYTDTNVTNGKQYYYQVSAKNSAGEGPLSEWTNATPNEPPNQRPNATITHPSPGEKVSGVYTIEGDASDPDGTIERVEIRIGNGSWHAATGTDSWSFDWDSAPYSNGNHTIQVRAWDGQEFSAVSSIQITVDNPVAGELEDWVRVAVALLIVIVVLVAVFAYILIKRRRLKGEEEPTESPPEEPL